MSTTTEEEIRFRVEVQGDRVELVKEESSNQDGVTERQDIVTEIERQDVVTEKSKALPGKVSVFKSFLMGAGVKTKLDQGAAHLDEVPALDQEHAEPDIFENDLEQDFDGLDQDESWDGDSMSFSEGEEDTFSYDHLLPGQSKKSVVWQFFTKLADDDDTVQCMICKKYCTYDRGSTSNLIKHINRIHPSEGVRARQKETTWGFEDDHRSVVWSTFIRDASNPHRVQCKNCKRFLKFNGSSTTGMLRHIGSCKKDGQEGSIDSGTALSEEEAVQLLSNRMDPESTTSANHHGNPKRKSVVWSIFKKLENKEGARCKICRRLVKDSGSSTGALWRHVKSLHPSVYDSVPETVLCNKESSAWSNFEKLDNGEGVQCKVCGRLLKQKRRNTSVLWSHMKSCQGSSPGGIGRTEGGRVKRSSIWLHFEDVVNKGGKETMKARCKLCECLLNVISSDPTLSLRRHLRSKHTSVYMRDCKTVQSNKGSNVWSHYKKLDNEEAECNYCEQVLKRRCGSTSGLWRHIQRCHPRVYANIQGGK